MATTGGGAAYQRLEKIDDGISQGLQYWGGQQAQANEAERGRQERKAAADAAAKAKAKEDLDKDLKSKLYDFTSKDAGYNSLTENYADFSREVEQHYSDLRDQYAKAKSEGRDLDAYKLEGQLQKAVTAFKEQQGAADKFKTIYDQYSQMERDGKLSDYDREKWKMIKGFASGDSRNTFLKYDPETGMGKWRSRQLNEDGTESWNELTVADIDNGRVAPLMKLDVNGKGGLVDQYINQMGTIEQDWYTSGRDRSTKGYNEYAEQKLRSKIFNDLDDGEVKDLAAQFFQTTSGLDDPAKFKEAKNAVVEELRSRVMGAEDIKNSSKLNLGEATLAQRDREIAQRNKPKPKVMTKEEEQAGARRFNIESLAGNQPDDRFFKNGDFKWKGNDFEAIDSKIVGDKIVIKAKTKGGEPRTISVNRRDGVAVNDLFNAFEGTTTKFDRVQAVEPLAWRERIQTQPKGVTDYAKASFDTKGVFSGNHGDFQDAILEVYPEAKVENIYAPWKEGDIQVNSKPIYLKGRTKADIEAQVAKAMEDTTGATGATPSPGAAEDLRTKYNY